MSADRPDDVEHILQFVASLQFVAAVLLAITGVVLATEGDWLSFAVHTAGAVAFGSSAFATDKRRALRAIQRRSR